MSEKSSPFDRPLRVLFLLTSMPVGGAETLLVNLVRRFDRRRIEPLIGCLKQKGVLGEAISNEVPIFENLINHKYDVAVIGRLKKLFRDQSVDAIITIGAGDKMFWGRIAARQAKVPVILSALHSTGWPDGVGRLNRMLTGITDGFIAVAKQHAEYQVNVERFPAEKVFLIPNGIDTERFVFDPVKREQWRKKLDIAETTSVIGIVAALRPEKNHRLFLAACQQVFRQNPTVRFVIAGDGPARDELEKLANELGIADCVHFLGSVDDVVGVLSMLDLFALTSDNEASPVSILEAFSCERPVVATDVGSIDETVIDRENGFLVPVGDCQQMTDRWLEILGDKERSRLMGEAGRTQVLKNSSLEQMTCGYMKLVEDCFASKLSNHPSSHSLAALIPCPNELVGGTDNSPANSTT
jgi:glycosyltransferase involved in cell wall biosynthesis